MDDENKKRLTRLFLISFVSLFFELLYIRWIPDAVHILSFFGNFTLLAVFLGLGIGLALPLKEEEENKVFIKIIINFFILSLVIVFFDLFKFGVPFSGEYAFNEDYFSHTLKINIHLIITLFMALSIYTFIPVGYMINILFRKHKPLVAYSVNIAGSLAGIIVFSILSYLGTPVWAWMIAGLLVLIVFAKNKFKYIAVILCLAGIIFSANYANEKKFGFKKIWSPYYALRFTKNDKDHYNIFIGNSFILSGYNLYNNSDTANALRQYYEFPYRIKKAPENVLILGAGMGNDISAAIKNGAAHIDAVEIDPEIIDLGKKYHPLNPYNNPKVTIITNDARTYTKNTKKKYDLIVFGTLDSHGLFSHMSSIKMENYVYTLESFKEAKKLLKDDGILYVNTGNFGSPVVMGRLYYVIKEAFGKPPMFFMFNTNITMFLNGNLEQAQKINFAGSGLSRVNMNDDFVRANTPQMMTLPMDDWPHLFLMEKKIPSEYLFALFILFVISAIFVYFYFGKAKNLNINYFFLGVGFMLLETKSITEMGLVFGATWFVNAVVISSIMLIILVVNLLLLKYEKFDKIYLMYILLAITLAAAYLFPVSKLNITNFYLKFLASVVFISLPICFASFIFGMNFRKSGGNTTIYLAANMLGAVFGGIVEYSSMIYGLKAMYIFAFAMYFIAMLAMTRDNSLIKDK